MDSNRERQDNEMLSLESICNKNEFIYKLNNNTGLLECLLIIYPEVNSKKILITYTYQDKCSSDLSVQYLPPIRMYISIPKEYPSESAPKYHLSVNWLPSWETSLACQKLDEIWNKNENNEILFIWFNYLKNDLLQDLKIEEILDISFVYSYFKEPMNKNLKNLWNLKDSRVINKDINKNPIEIFVDNNNIGIEIQFKKDFHDCEICFGTYIGLACVKLNICNHVFCKKCVLQYLESKIEEQNVISITCPGHKCPVEIKTSEIEKICSPETFQKYENILTDKTLLTMPDTVYCPRKNCNMLATIESEDNLAYCAYCQYSFCALCNRVYHGIEACKINSLQKMELLDKYLAADIAEKKQLEKIYGRQQIKEIEEDLSQSYLKDNAKKCPDCRSVITKTSGCNLMTCGFCNSHFCYICGIKTDNDFDDPYDHFKTYRNSPCSGKLFDDLQENIDY